MRYVLRLFIVLNLLIDGFIRNALAADDPKELVKDYSDRMIEILQGPVSKLFGAIILLIGVTALLRGRHGIAISCGLAFVMLLFLPILLQHLGN